METANQINFQERHITRIELEEILGMRPRNIDIYQTAFIHKSVQKIVRKRMKENPEEKILPFYLDSNERLEFLGDSILNFTIANFLYQKYSDKDEGFLTRIRTKLVSGKNCAHFAKRLDLGKYIVLSNHVNKINGRNNNRILEDTMESFIGAVFLDIGIEFAQKFILSLVDKYIDMEELMQDNNYKDILLRYSQKLSIDHPVYNIERQKGPPHKRFFTMSVRISEEIYGIASAKSKKIAEQLAAKNALSKVNHKELEGIIDRDSKIN